jgi:hypothetical protein
VQALPSERLFSGPGPQQERNPTAAGRYQFLGTLRHAEGITLHTAGGAIPALPRTRIDGVDRVLGDQTPVRDYTLHEPEKSSKEKLEESELQEGKPKLLQRAWQRDGGHAQQHWNVCPIAIA